MQSAALSSPPASAFASLIARLCPRDSMHETAIPGFWLIRSSTNKAPRNTLNRAVMCVVAQGSKSVLMNGQRCVYDPSRFLLVSMDLPLVGQIEEASASRPFLGCSLVLDFDEIASLLVEARLSPKRNDRPRPGLMVGTLTDDMLDAVVRLVRLTEHPGQIAVLAPLIRRELYFRLLLSDHSALLQRMAAENGKATRIAAGLDWLRQNAARPIRMEELARELHMSPSAMHTWFRSVTSMSPLQFQKQLRLQEARRLMFSEHLDAGTAARRVGYESPSQFSREYSRFFGTAPLRDIEALRLQQATFADEKAKTDLHRQIVAA